MGFLTGSKKVDQQQSPDAKRASQIAEQLFRQTDPLRQTAFSGLASNLQTASPFQPITMDSLTANPMFGAIKSATEQQFQNARQNIIGNTPNGGALFSALGNLEGQRANQLSSAFGGLAQDELSRRTGNLDRAIGIGTGVAGQSMGGLSNAAAIQAQLAQAQREQQSAEKGGKGELIGTIGSSLLLKP
jgi:hypothetical protein